MSDGLSDANRDGRLIADVERAAEDLRRALFATRDLAFFKAHPQAVEYANEILAAVDLQLVKIK